MEINTHIVYGNENLDMECPYFNRGCDNGLIECDKNDGMCHGDENVALCGTYQVMKRLSVIKRQVEQKTSERKRNILSLLTGNVRVRQDISRQ